MRLTIAARHKPFSHRPGTSCLAPGLPVVAKVFPSRIELFALEAAETPRVCEIEIRGPVPDFTVEQDLERGWLRVWGSATSGYFRYRLQPNSKGLELLVEKSADRPLVLKIEGQAETLMQGEKATVFDLPNGSVQRKPERLSLGSHRKQDWDLVTRRGNLAEIFPLWLSLANWYKPAAQVPSGGTVALLDRCRDAIQDSEKLELVSAFSSLFNAGFHGLFVPQLHDSRYLGLVEPADPNCLPLSLLLEGAKLLRSLFVSVEAGQGVSLLPCCPPEFHCGRMTDVDCGEIGTLSFEWSKKQLRQVEFTAAKSGQVDFRLPKDLRSFRLRSCRKEIGARMVATQLVDVEAGKTYFLDRFQK